MKKLLTLAIVSICAAAALADAAVTNTPPRRHRRPRRPSAGILEFKEAIPSKQIAVFDAQKSLDAAQVAAIIKAARQSSSLPLLQNDDKAPARIDIVETDAFGTIAVYPEDFKAAVNVKALAADHAAPDVVARRLKTELTRVAYYLMGCGAYGYGCITRPVLSLKELDALANDGLCAEATLHLAAGRRIGIKAIRYTTYERACQLGWAPPPTNEIQRIVWEKAKAEANTKPTNPLKITREPAK